MKLKYIAIFALAFAICAGWNLLFDAPKTAKPAVETAAKLQEEKEPQGSWPAPLRPLEIRIYPYLHFHEAMDNKIKKIPVYVAINAISKPMQPSSPRKTAASTTTVPSTRLASSGPSWSTSNPVRPSKAAAPSASRSSRMSSFPRTGLWPARPRNSSWPSCWNITTAKMKSWKSI